MARKENSQNSPPRPQGPEALAALAERLVHHAESIRNPAAKAMKEDLREAARILDHLRAGIYEVVRTTKDEAIQAYLTKLLEGV